MLFPYPVQFHVELTLTALLSARSLFRPQNAMVVQGQFRTTHHLKTGSVVSKEERFVITQYSEFLATDKKNI